MLDLGSGPTQGNFCLIGETRALSGPGRRYEEGHEIGNHTYTIPNRGAGGEVGHAGDPMPPGCHSSLTATTLLLPPPYNADAEPTSAEEVRRSYSRPAEVVVVANTSILRIGT